jgi:hypothetical protein
MTELNFSRKIFLKKKKEALAKINSFQENFRKKELKIKADLEVAGRIWKELGERFKWWSA